MKRIFFYFIIFIFLILSSGCNSSKELQTLKQENESLRSDISSIGSNLSKLDKENESLKQENESLNKEIDELKNGAERRLGEIHDAYNKKDYDKVLELSSQLSQLHPGSKEALEAEGLVAKVNEIKQEEQIKAEAEAEKARQEAEKSAQEKAREIIRVKSVYPSEPNSASGVDLYIVWQNKSEKTIKYITFEVEPYNAVNDIVRCSIRGTSTFRGQETGPIKTNEWRDDSRYWECPWYNNTITKVKLLQIDIEYMDGSTITMTGKDIDYISY